MKTNNLYIKFIQVVFFLLTILLFNSALSSQNLVDNPSFENITFYEKEQDVRGKANDRIKKFDSWNIFFSGDYCNCQNKYTVPRRNLDTYCQPTSNFKANTGCNMLGLIYSMCESNTIGQTTLNCSGYAFTKLNRKMEVGKIYEVSYWVYLPKIQFDDTSIVYHIGFIPLRKSPTFYDLRMFYNNLFLTKSIVYDKWFEAKWLFRPSCDMTHIMIGVFQNENWKGQLKSYNPAESTYYYIDDVDVKEIKIDDTSKIVDIDYYCKEPEIKPEFTLNRQTTLIHFNTNEYQILDQEFEILDSIGKLIAMQPNQIFEIIGHTDDIGSNHELLSKQRAEAVRNYLIDKFKIQPIRLIEKYVGNKFPLSKKNTPEERAINRRVEIKLSTITIANIFYEKVLTYVKDGKMDSANIYLNRWKLAVQFQNLIFPLFDDRLNQFKETKYWDKFYDDLREMYRKKYPKGDLAYILDSMSTEDQRYRRTEDRIEYLTGDIDPVKYKFDYPKITLSQWDSLDNFNNIFCRKLIDQHGFPTESEVGERAAHTSFLIIAHSADTIQMKYFLPIIENLCRLGEANWMEFAILTDKIQTYRNKPQLFGTQFKKMSGKNNDYELYDYESLEVMNFNRMKYGLPLLTPKSLHQVRSFYYTHIINQ